jgi:putative Holliday junction resolvase
MRFLALDLGDKRTGIAVGDDETGIVSPVRVIDRPASQESLLLDDIAREADSHKPDALVVGLPLNMDDTEGPQAKKARALGERAAARLSLPLFLHDERLTSEAADWSMHQSGLTRGQKKARRDALAAAEILRDFLSTRGG